ncbi:MAG: class I SAM-dependent methyltransferase [Rhizobiales bacterium]|nr:class I SAM-dependent methyltransferase [Hyphomicrobiales bacterium]
MFDDATVHERFMGRWSRAVGEKFLTWLDPPRGQKWLDVGCGTGAFSQLIMDKFALSVLVGVDPAPAQIEYARKALQQVEFRVGDALAMPFDNGVFDTVSDIVIDLIEVTQSYRDFEEYWEIQTLPFHPIGKRLWLDFPTAIGPSCAHQCTTRSRREAMDASAIRRAPSYLRRAMADGVGIFLHFVVVPDGFLQETWLALTRGCGR